MIQTPKAESGSTDNLNAAEHERYHHGDLKRTLVSAALSLLTEKQDWDFSLREVARRAGVSHNAPYNHFDSKQDLLAAVAAAGYDLLTEHMRAATEHVHTPSAELKAIEIAYVLFGVENPAHYRLMFGAALSTAKCTLPPPVWESAAAAKELLRGVIRRGAEEGHFAISPTSLDEVEIAVLSSWSLVHGLTMLYIDGLANSPPQTALSAAVSLVAAHVTQLMMDGISSKPGSA